MNSPSPVMFRFAIFDILGREMATLVDQLQYPGEYSVVWGGKQEGGEKAATGVYLVRFSVGNQSQTKKFLLLR